MSGPYYLARLASGDLGELDSSNPGGGTNTASGTAMNGVDLTATPNGSEVTGIAGMPIYGAYSTDPALQPKAGQVLVCSGDPPAGTGLVKQLYWTYLPKMYQPSIVNGTASTIPAGSFVNIYDDSGTLKMRPAQLTSTHTWPAHGITTKDAATTAGTSGTDNVSKVAMGSIIGGFNATATPYAGLLTPGSWYWLDNANPGGYTATRPTAAGDGHQRVGFAVSEFEMFIVPFPTDEDLGSSGGGGGGGGSASTLVTATNSTGSTIAANKAVNLYNNAGVLSMRLSDLSGDNNIPITGFTIASVANGSTGSVLLFGILNGFTGLTPDDKMYAHDVTPGQIAPTNGYQYGMKRSQYAGLALSSTSLYVNPGPVEEYPPFQFTISVLNNTGSTIVANSAVGIINNSGTPNMVLADLTHNPVYQFRGFVLRDVPNGANGSIVLEGVVPITGLTTASFYWLDDATPGAITTTAPADTSPQQRVGYALDADHLLILPMQLPANQGKQGMVRVNQSTSTPIAQLAGQSTGGNSRGTDAVDLQLDRLASDQVAAGEYSTIVGGSQNKVSSTGGYGTVLGGLANEVDSAQGVAMGFNAKASRYGEVAIGAGLFNVRGDAQSSSVRFIDAINGNSPTEIFLDGPTGSLRFTLEEGRAFTYDLVAVARDAASGGAPNSWRGKGNVYRDTGGNITLVEDSLESLPNPTNGGWALSLAADTTNQALTVTVTGGSGITVNWLVEIRFLEIG